MTRSTHTKPSFGLLRLLAMFAILCGIIGLLISEYGPGATSESAAAGRTSTANQPARSEAIERALEHLDQAAATLSTQCQDNMNAIDQARSILRQASIDETP